MPDFFDVFSLRFSAVLPQVMAGLVVTGAFWLLARFVGGLIVRLQSRVAPDHKHLISLLADVVGWAVFGVGIIAGLGTAGINVTALVAGLGLTGFAIGFAMKDILSNGISGILVMLFRPFKKDDVVRIDKFQGKVVDINFRYTVLQAPGATVMVPNALAHTQVVVVLSEDAAQAPAVSVKAAPPKPAV